MNHGSVTQVKRWESTCTNMAIYVAAKESHEATHPWHFFEMVCQL
jgi:hypothetical protein